MNVLLVVLDTARRDALEPYGSPAGSTPAIDQLAGRGIAVEQAYATASWTLPSHASMFTGLLPRRLGLAQAPAGTPQSARPAFERVADRMLGQVLRDAGFASHGLTTNVWVSPPTGLDIGFDSFEYVSSGREERMNGLLGNGLRAQLAWAREGLRADGDDGAAAVSEKLRRLIGEWSGQPTFWFVNLSECHSPYLPPRPWNDLSALERVRAALDNRSHLTFESICKYAAGRHEVPAEAFERMRHLYTRAVSYMDRWVADVLESLDARGILDETLVIVTADHGENFGEGGLIAHGFSLDERLIHIPLVMAGPGAVERDDVFSLAELPRVIADAAGIERHPYSRDELPSGVAVAQYDPMAPADDPRIVSFAEKWQVDPAGIERICARFTCATDGETKLTVRNDEELVHDLRSDPGEMGPAGPGAGNGAVDALRDALKHPALERDLEPVPATSVGAIPSAEDAADIERRMKLLGYM